MEIEISSLEKKIYQHSSLRKDKNLFPYIPEIVQATPVRMPGSLQL